MQLAAFFRDVFCCLALQFADKFQLNSKADKPSDKLDLARAAVLGHQSYLATGDGKCKAPGGAGMSSVLMLSPSRVTIYKVHIKKAHEGEEPQPKSSWKGLWECSFMGSEACFQPRFLGKLQPSLLQTKGCTTEESKAELAVY